MVYSGACTEVKLRKLEQGIEIEILILINVAPFNKSIAPRKDPKI